MATAIRYITRIQDADDFATLDAVQFVTIAATGYLTNERALTGTANQITVTDGGAGAAVTLSTPQDIHAGASPTFLAMALTGTGVGNGLTIGGDAQWYRGAADQLRTPDSVVVDGSVGIGTNGPDGRLHIFTSASGGTVSTTYDDLVIESAITMGMQMLTANTKDQYIAFGDEDDDDAGRIRYNHPNNYMAFRTNGGERVRIDSSGNVGIGITAPTAQLHVDQASTTAAIPVLYLDQADLSEEMIEFNTTIGVGNPIEAVGAKALTTTHFIRITVTGVGYLYVPAGTIA